MADERAAHFIENLAALAESDRGALARLRRNAGESIGTSRGVSGIFYRLLPDGIAGGFDEEIYFLVATLYGLNDNAKHEGNFGTTMAVVKAAKDGSAAVDRRMAILLDSEFALVDGRRLGGGEMAYRLRQLVKMAAGHSVGIDWPRLITDLSYWNHPERRVRKAWAQAYYTGNPEAQKPEAVTTEGV